MEPGETVSSVARRNGVAPNLVYRWRRLINEGGVAAVGSDDGLGIRLGKFDHTFKRPHLNARIVTLPAGR